MKLFRNIFLSLALLIGLPALVAPPAMATQVLLNNVKSKLTAAVGVSDTTISITAGDGAQFALATGGNTIRATLVKISGFREIAWEIVDVTARSTDTLTITRARESTTALTFAIGDVIDVRFTAGLQLAALNGTATTSAQLAAIISDETGSGLAVFNNNPTLIGATLTGTVSGGGNQINNVIIGASTPLAGTFTTITGTDATDATSSTAAAMKTAGGLAVAKSAIVGVNMGVGVAPTHPLTVATTAAGIVDTAKIWNQTSVAADVGASYIISGGVAGNGLASVGGAFAGAATTDGAYMIFKTRVPTAGTLTERVRIDPVGHIKLSTTAPALTSCGSSPAITGSDGAGTVTMGTGSPTGCVITFNVAYTSTAPHCVVTWQTNITSMQYTISTTAITLVQTGTSSNKVNYVCFAST
jgi:hypothetical protein